MTVVETDRIDMADESGELTLDFGEQIDLTDTPVGLKLRTDEFPRD
ncbi:hypothetical protein [Streptomyces sp. CMB-StM0423]|nr:hypothetical protein [Streptomyces sp. CMB-StM0423]